MTLDVLPLLRRMEIRRRGRYGVPKDRSILSEYCILSGNRLVPEVIGKAMVMNSDQAEGNASEASTGTVRTRQS